MSIRPDMRMIGTLVDKSEESYTPIIQIPQIIGKWRKDHRKCERFNYIPHDSPTHKNKDIWLQVYFEQLLIIHDIVYETINERYPKNNFYSEKKDTFSELSNLVYNCSSKYISDLDLIQCENISKE